MTTEELAAIRERDASYFSRDWSQYASQSMLDRRALLAEVDRLRAMPMRTGCDACLAERDALKAQVEDQLRGWADECDAFRAENERLRNLAEAIKNMNGHAWDCKLTTWRRIEDMRSPVPDCTCGWPGVLTALTAWENQK
jgi:hypothetical protein